MDLNRMYRKKRTAQFLKKLGWIFGSLLFLALLAWGFFWLPFFRITNIVADDYVQGSELNRTISPYLASVNKFWLPKNNYFLFDQKEIVALLKSEEIGVAEADKKFPKTLEIKFSNAEPWLIYCHTDGKCFYVSPSGILADTSPRFSGNPLPHLTIENNDKSVGEIVLSDGEISSFKTALAEFRNVGTEINEIKVTKDIKFSTKENWYLLINKDADVSKIFSDLKLLLDQKIKDDRGRLEYIDMRFENKAFYKLKN